MQPLNLSIYMAKNFEIMHTKNENIGRSIEKFDAPIQLSVMYIKTRPVLHKNVPFTCISLKPP